MEANKCERVDEIVEEIIDNLRPLRCAAVTAQRAIRRIIERGPPRNFHNRPGVVRQYAEQLQKWITVGKTLLPMRSSSGVLDVEHIPPEIRVQILIAAGVKDFLDGLEEWPYEHVEECLAAENRSKVAHEYDSEFFTKIERLAVVAEKGMKYRGPVDTCGKPLPFDAPQFDPIKQACAENALELMITFSKKRPTAAPDQNLRIIASLLYEAHNGEPDKDLERACKRARKHWGRHGYTDAKPGLLIQVVDADGRIVASYPPPA
jgi:hypothetical protein